MYRPIDTVGALDRVDGYLKNRPKDARGRFMKALILAEQNKPNDAIKLFTEDIQQLHSRISHDHHTFLSWYFCTRMVCNKTFKVEAFTKRIFFNGGNNYQSYSNSNVIVLFTLLVSCEKS